MKFFLRQAASVLLLISAAHSLPDFSCICEKQNQNACARTYSCRLNNTINFNSDKPPSWVTAAEEGLFNNTINDALNGELRPPFFTLGRMTWEATIACDDEDGQLRWHHHINECRFGTNATEKRRMHGWANLGFHPLGTQKGTWLTQILGEIADINGTSDTQLTQGSCSNTGLFVHLSYINASEPYDPRFSPAGDWGVLYNGEHVYPVGAAGVPSYRTDNDLIDNGVALDCTGYDTTGFTCTSPGCVEPANITQYRCPAGVDGFPVGAANCSRAYQANVALESAGARLRDFSALGLAAVVAYAVL